MLCPASRCAAARSRLTADGCLCVRGMRGGANYHSVRRALHRCAGRSLLWPLRSRAAPPPTRVAPSSAAPPPPARSSPPQSPPRPPPSLEQRSTLRCRRSSTSPMPPSAVTAPPGGWVGGSMRSRCQRCRSRTADSNRTPQGSVRQYPAEVSTVPSTVPFLPARPHAQPRREAFASCVLKHPSLAFALLRWATAGGGALYAEGSKVAVNGTTFAGNTASGLFPKGTRLCASQRERAEDTMGTVAWPSSHSLIRLHQLVRD